MTDPDNRESIRSSVEAVRRLAGGSKDRILGGNRQNTKDHARFAEKRRRQSVLAVGPKLRVMTLDFPLFVFPKDKLRRKPDIGAEWSGSAEMVACRSYSQ